MLKRILIIFFLFLQYNFSFGQLNMSLLSQFPFPAARGDASDIWGYVDEFGNEYAIIGLQNGVSIVNVTIPTAPVEVFYTPGVNTFWRDIKTWNNKAYITNEGGNGLMIIDLDPLPGSSTLTVTNYTGSTYPFTKAHNLFVDENGYAYIFGANSGVGGAIILNLNLPTTDLNFEAGRYNQYYLHDGMVRGDTLWGGAINDGFLVAIDVASKSSPITMATKSTPSFFTHNCWISDDGQTLFTTDEKSNAFIGAYNVSDVNNISEVGRIQSSPGMGVIPHNVHFMNNYIITSYYRDGVTIHDVTNPSNMIEVGNYDTSPAFNGNGFNGCWGVYPWLPSGNLIASDIENKLIVIGANYTRASYLEGKVTDLNTSAPINGATVKIMSSNATSTNVIGDYKTGVAIAGSYNIVFSKAGYLNDTIFNVSLTSGNITIVNAQLEPLVTFNFQVKVFDAITLNPVPNAKIRVENGSFSSSVNANISGIYNFSNFTEETYNISAGKWQNKTHCDAGIFVKPTNNSHSIYLDRGYYDDFSFNYNWTVTGTATSGIWVRGIPIGTLLGLEESNPGYDVSNDCNLEAFVTGNGGGNAGDDDVDGGETILTSPIFDVSNIANPYVNYYRWFYNAGGTGSPNDQLTVKLSNGSTTVTIETVTANTPNNSTWVSKKYKISDYLAPTNNMRIIVTVNDIPGGHVSEGAFDKFEITDGTVGLNENEQVDGVRIFPNPFTDDINVQFLKTNYSSVRIEVSDVVGRVLDGYNLGGNNQIKISNNYTKGIYLMNIYEKGTLIKSQKLIKY